MALEDRIGFIGSGKMATALAGGLVKAELYGPDRILAGDKLEAARDAFSEATGAETTGDNAVVIDACRIVVLAVKPQHIDDLLKETGGHFTPEHLVISIAAGVPTERIEAFLPEGCRVIRAMPNTPMLVGKGAAAVCAGSCTKPGDIETAKKLLESAAMVITVDEQLIDAVTAVSGSGPAYFFYLVEALANVGVEHGLTTEQAEALARRTFTGAAELLASSERTAAQRRADVTSPGGTTQAAIEAFDAAGTPRIVADAVRAAVERGKELGRS